MTFFEECIAILYTCVLALNNDILVTPVSIAWFITRADNHTNARVCTCTGVIRTEPAKCERKISLLKSWRERKQFLVIGFSFYI